MVSFPRAISQQPGYMLTSLENFHHGKDSVLSFLWILFMVIDLLFMNIILLPKLPSMDLQNALFSVSYAVKHSTVSDQGDKCDSGSTPLGSISFHISLSSQSSCLNRTVEWPFKTQLSCQIRHPKLVGLGQSSSKASIGFKAVTT